MAWLRDVELGLDSCAREREGAFEWAQSLALLGSAVGISVAGALGALGLCGRGLCSSSSALDFPTAQTVKRLPAMQETRVRSLVGDDPLEKAMATHSSTLAWKIPWTEEPGRLQSLGSQRVGHE